MIVDEPDRRDHRTATREGERQVPVDPAKHGGDDHTTDRGHCNVKPAATRGRPRVGAPLVGYVEKLIERVETHPARQQPAQNCRCREKNKSLNHQLIACEQGVDKSKAQLTP